MSGGRTIRGVLFSGGHFVLTLPDGAREGHGPAADRDRLAAGTLTVDGRPRPVDGLLARDFHALRALAAAAGALPDAIVSAPCENCGRRTPVRPAALFERGPFEAGELHDPELDAPFLYDVLHPIAGRDGEVLVRLSERTAGELLPAWRAVAEGRTPFARALIGPWGIARLGGDEEPGLIARRLRSDETLAASLEELLLRAHYPARLQSLGRCAHCEGAIVLDCPFHREFLDDELDDPAPGALPPLAAFIARADAAAAPFLAADAEHAEGLTPRPRVVFRVDDGVPAVDAGGAPLLGSYRPSVDGLPPIVTLYYRTFAARADEPFDWQAELDETVAHEFAHHAAALAGHDATADDEEDALDAEEVRRRGAAVVAKERSILRQPLFWAIAAAIAALSVLAIRGH